MKLFLSIFSTVCVVCAANFAASGEISGNTENIKNIAVWQTTHKRMAIFDAGGFLVEDSLKSVEICSLMQKVRYSAIAVGEEELRFGKDFWDDMNKRFSLPLIATNIKTKNKIFEKIRVVEYDSGDKYAMISVLWDENFDISTDYEITDPREALSSAIAAIPQNCIIVLLAHCDPALTDSLIKEFPRISYGVQGHRKKVSEPVAMCGNKQILQFWHGGGQIAVLNKKGLVKWKFFVQKMANTSNNLRKQETQPAISIDIFTMSGCPYSKNAIIDFLPLMKNKNYSITVCFAGNYDSSTHKLSPGLPDGCVEEEKIWLAMQNLYPERFQDFLFLASKQSSDSRKIAETMGLDSVKFAKWDAEKGDSILAQNYKKSQYYNITECPTIAINNEIIYISPRNIIRNLCNLAKDTICFDLGECDIDENCPNSEEGIGVCQEKKCAAIKEVLKITFIDSEYETPNLPIDYVLESTLGLVWQIKIDTLFLRDSITAEMLERFHIERLPAVIFDKSAERLHNFNIISQKLIEELDGFVLDWGEIPDGEYYKRNFHEKELVVIADSVNAKNIKPFLEESVRDWHLLTDNETDGWLIWWENKCLTGTKELTEAKTLINYYQKIKGEL
ncbi:MAG: hypothetical protein LBH98_02520 [Chitinispirillales bacterium]|nr:hypothetical protein [Chitinispirillales bacterium]